MESTLKRVTQIKSDCPGQWVLTLECGHKKRTHSEDKPKICALTECRECDIQEGPTLVRLKHGSIKAFCATDGSLKDPLFIEGEFQIDQPECLKGCLHDAVITLKSGNVYLVSSTYLEVE